MQDALLFLFRLIIPTFLYNFAIIIRDTLEHLVLKKLNILILNTIIMDNYVKNVSEISESAILNKVMARVFMLMTFALVVTGVTSYLIIGNENILMSLFSNISTFYIICGAELLLVFILSLFINKISFNVALIMFALYSIMNGVTLAPLLFMYTEESVTSTFLITAGTFGAMALFGYTTKTSLTSMGKILMMALIGLIIASIVNIFLNSSGFEMILNYAGVLIFVGLTAYDTQKVKVYIQEAIENDNVSIPKLAVMSALTLYLDFINLFIRLLSILGKRK